MRLMPTFKLVKRLSFILFLILLFSIVFNLPSRAAYTPPEKISTATSPTNSTIYPQMVPDIDGYLHLVWMETDLWWTRPNPGIFYSRWNGDTWSSPVKISQNTGFAAIPSIAVDSNKIVHAVYMDDTGFPQWRFRTHYTKRQLDGSWTTPITIRHPPSFCSVDSPKITVDTSNNLHVVYTANDASCYSISVYYTKYDVGTREWSSPVQISYDTDGVTLNSWSGWGEIQADKQGNVHVMYWDWQKGIFYRKLSGGTWSTPVKVVETTETEFNKMTVDDNGNPFVIWFATRNESIWVRRTVDQVWQEPELLSTGARRSLWGMPIMGITTNSKNVIAAGWAEEGSPADSHYLYDVVYRYHSGGVWSAPDSVRTDRPFPDAPHLIRDKWDNQHIVWSEATSMTDPKSDLWYSVVQGKQQTVGTAGGTVVVDPGGVTAVTLNFASGALAADTLITVLIGPLPESVDPTVVTVPRAFTFGPEGLAFPAGKYPTVTFTYTDAELEGGDPKTLQAFIWDSQTSTYTAHSGSVNTGQKTLTVTDINHFSLFALAAKRVSFLPPFEDGLEVEENSILPLRFKLGGEGKVEVQLKKEGNVKKAFSLDDDLKQEKEGVYHLNLSTKGLELGEYQIVILLDNVKVAETHFKVVQKGKGKELELLEFEVPAVPEPTATLTPIPTQTPTLPPTVLPPSESSTPTLTPQQLLGCFFAPVYHK